MTTDPDLELIEAAMERDTRLQMIDALQEMVDWLRDNPQVPIPYGIGGACFLGWSFYLIPAKNSFLQVDA